MVVSIQMVSSLRAKPSTRLARSMCLVIHGEVGLHARQEARSRYDHGALEPDEYDISAQRSACLTEVIASR
jgi:hypothetical protein